MPGAAAGTDANDGVIASPGQSLISLFRPYRRQIILLVVLTIATNTLGLMVPRLIAQAIDQFDAGQPNLTVILIGLCALAVGAFVFGNLQNFVQVYASEKVALDLRTRVAGVISQQDYASIERLGPSRLLTNLTSDVDAIKTFVSQAVASLISSVFLIFGASALLLWLDFRLAIAVLLVLPFIAATFFLVLKRVRALFGQVQGMTDSLNKVLNENILGAAVVRLLNAQQREFSKFLVVNGKARGISMNILRQFALMIPVITFLTNISSLTILILGGHFVITGQMTLGDFMAFYAYLSILIFPIIVIGFMSNAVAAAQASYGRISVILNALPAAKRGEAAGVLSGAIEVRNLNLSYGGKTVLKDISFMVKAKSRTAIIGPTAGGKSQLFYLMTGLLTPTSGEVLYDGKPIEAYARESLHAQMGFVFQDSALFNLTLRENIAFNTEVSEVALRNAIETAELHDFIAALPQGLETVVSERGISLSGGQKQRVMLARALAIEPSILFLDDFTARVDVGTEAKILANVRANYPDLTLISITQKVVSIQDYDQIVLLMEGEILAIGTHTQLLKSSPEYVQILDSQNSTDHYGVA
jgi:ATP-binding cassette subfamily B protein